MAKGDKKASAPIEAEIATTGDGRDITKPWIRELEEAGDPRLLASIGWGVYDRILLDDQVKSCMEQRIRAVVSRDWQVVSGEPGDPRADAAAEKLSDAIQRVGWDRVCEKMLYAPLFGYAVAELLWKPIDGLFQWRQIRVRHARRFRYDKDGNLRLLTRAKPLGEILPTENFWVVRSGGTDDDTPYGRGLAEWLYFPVWFKRNGVRFWNTFLDKFSVPTAVGKYPRGASKDERKNLLAALRAIATDSGITIPEGMEIDLLELGKTGADFGEVCRYMDAAIAKIILSQTMTTEDGSSRSQAEVHAGVKLEIVKADADLLTDAFAEGPARWFTDHNFGPDVAAPRVVRDVEEEADRKVEAEIDEILLGMGYRRTDESFRDTYGDGYERVEPAGPRAKQPAAPAATPAANDDKAAKLQIASFAVNDPKPLYVYRQVKNADEIASWAKAQGFKSMLPGGELHVTVMYSRRPVNWYDMVSGYVLGDRRVIDSGGLRVVDQLGDAVVLHFADDELNWRNRQMREAGASWDHPQYLPHITLTYLPGDLDLTKIEPYRGRIVLGPEIFEPIEEDWQDGVAEVALAEPEPARDVVDDAVDAMMVDDGWRKVMAPIVEPLLDRLKGATSADDVARILAEEAERDDDGTLADTLARAGFALRLDALADTSEAG